LEEDVFWAKKSNEHDAIKETAKKTKKGLGKSRVCLEQKGRTDAIDNERLQEKGSCPFGVRGGG